MNEPQRIVLKQHAGAFAIATVIGFAVGVAVCPFLWSSCVHVAEGATYKTVAESVAPGGSEKAVLFVRCAWGDCNTNVSIISVGAEPRSPGNVFQFDAFRGCPDSTESLLWREGRLHLRISYHSGSPIHLARIRHGNHIIQYHHCDDVSSSYDWSSN